MINLTCDKMIEFFCLSCSVNINERERESVIKKAITKKLFIEKKCISEKLQTLSI